MAIKGPPNFAAMVNPDDFKVPGGEETVSALKAAGQEAQSISYDWSGVDAALNGMNASADFYSQRAAGKGLTAGRDVAAKQEDLSANNGISDPRSLGIALMRQSRLGASQSADVMAADRQERMSAAQAAMTVRNTQMQAQMMKLKADLDLQSFKNSTALGVQQATQGYELAQKMLSNQFALALLNAKNSKDAAQIQADQANWQQIMSYVKAGVSAASMAASAGAGFAGAAGVGNPAGAPNGGRLQMNSGAPLGQMATPVGANGMPTGPLSLGADVAPPIPTGPGGTYQLTMPNNFKE